MKTKNIFRHCWMPAREGAKLPLAENLWSLPTAIFLQEWFHFQLFFFFSVRRITEFHRLIPLEVSFMPPFSSFSWSSISPIQTCQRYLYLFPAPPFHDIDNVDCVHCFPKYDRKVDFSHGTQQDSNSEVSGAEGGLLISVLSLTHPFSCSLFLFSSPHA